jgi:hypothetical protein
VTGGGYHLQFRLADRQVVLGLEGHRHFPASRLGGGHGQLQLTAGVIGQADVADLAGADRGVQEGQGFLDRGERVPGVHLVQVNGVGAEAAQ